MPLDAPVMKATLPVNSGGDLEGDEPGPDLFIVDAKKAGVKRWAVK